ncbi:MAG TPA: hypothetical protein VFJ62_09140, partial [Usitatibacter sp.]|nr:hypothetical protein [Usitatibacter sp.]
GFFQAYLFIFVVVDSRDNNEGRTSFAGMTKKLSSIVDRSISTRGLQERVGLVHFEFVQPIDDLPLAAGTYSGNLKRLATPAVQPQAVTDWIRTLVG